jgi:hypothetical protein
MAPKRMVPTHLPKLGTVPLGRVGGRVAIGRELANRATSNPGPAQQKKKKKKKKNLMWAIISPLGRQPLIYMASTSREYLHSDPLQPPQVQLLEHPQISIGL